MSDEHKTELLLHAMQDAIERLVALEDTGVMEATVIRLELRMAMEMAARGVDVSAFVRPQVSFPEPEEEREWHNPRECRCEDCADGWAA